MHRFLTAVFVALASPVWAQGLTSSGSVTAGWVFRPAVALGALWDSNPTTQNEGEFVDAETVTLVNPRTELDFHGRRATFSLGYSGTLERYQKLVELTRYDQRGRIDARYTMTPRLTLRTQQQMTLTPTTDQLELEGLPFTRVGSRMVTASGGFSYAVSARTNVKTDYLFQWVDFDREAEGRPDFRFLQGGHAHVPSVEVDHAIAKHVRIGGVYTYRHMVIDAGEEIFGAHRAQASVAFDIGPTTSVNGRAGFDYVALRDGTESKSGPSYGAGVSQRIRGVSINGGYERAFMPSFGFGGLTAFRTLRVGVGVPFRRLTTSASFSYRRTDPIVLRDVLVELDSYWTSATVGYMVARWLRVEGFVNVNQQYSSAQGDVQRKRVGVQVVTSKPMRIQ